MTFDVRSLQRFAHGTRVRSFVRSFVRSRRRFRRELGLEEFHILVRVGFAALHRDAKPLQRLLFVRRHAALAAFVDTPETLCGLC